MLAPALIYLTLNPGGAGSRGWGVPMATDIAFAVGILQLLGRRVPAALRILLLTLAIIDDIGAILVIALFYSSDFAWTGLLIAGGGVLVLVTCLRAGVRPGPVYWCPLLIIWSGLLKAGIHPTIAGVIVGLSAPVKPWLSREKFAEIAEASVVKFTARSQDASADDHARLTPLRTLAAAGREAISPAARALAGFHPWVAFLIMPLFALANAGVDLGGIDLEVEGATTVMLGVGLGLTLGKPLGILAVTWLFVKTGLCTLPRGVTWSGLTVLGLAAGIGFTMAIFIAELAFQDPALLAIAKLAIILATTAAAVAALLLGRLFLPRELEPEVARLTPADVEASTEF
jgi:NhaA family Na+:H+ antiporter